LVWLDEGVCSDGERYLEIRRRLVQYFDRRGCTAADELADETLNRAARKLAELGQIANVVPAQYCYVLARFVFLEYIRRPGHKDSEFDDASRLSLESSHASPHDFESPAAERELSRFESLSSEAGPCGSAAHSRVLPRRQTRKNRKAFRAGHALRPYFERT
jgi:DNA-directed RNA polymerase specialized sigma24 family protein